MAVFTQRQELTQQRKRHRFSKVTGWKKYALAAIGYDDKGQKNAKGKFIGGGGFFKNLAGGALAEGTDAEEVIKSNNVNHIYTERREKSWENFLIRK